MEKLCVKDRSVSFARTFVPGFCGNFFLFCFPLSWGFLVGDTPLKFYYFDFLKPFHFCSYKLYNSLQQIIFQKILNFFSRILIDLFSCQIANQLKTNFENG